MTCKWWLLGLGKHAASYFIASLVGVEVGQQSSSSKRVTTK